MTTPYSKRQYSTRNAEVELDVVPWSELGPGFIAKWGRSDPKDPQPEHLEIIGTTGSGKSFLLTQILAEMVRRRGSSVIIIVTKEADKTMSEMGWPIVSSWKEVTKHEQCIFWPQTNLKGVRRKAFQADRIQELLDNLWGADANTIVVFDEFVYIQNLSPDLKETCLMYLREGRSHGITCVMGKQRAQGVVRDMHSESNWKIGFKLTDQDDIKREAELFGNKTLYTEVINELDKKNYEFLIQSKNSDIQYISFVDKPVSTKLKQKDYYEK